MQWGDWGAIVVQVSAGVSGLYTLQRVLARIGIKRKDRTARKLFSNGHTDQIIDMIDEMREQRREDHRKILHLERQLREILGESEAT